MSFTFTDGARDDYDAGIDYYADRSAVAARAFVAEVDAGVEQIVRFPTRWRKETFETRIYRLPTFPYSLIYTETSSGIVVLAVAHHRRRPGYWRDPAVR